MSFGFSASDAVLLTQLAWKTVQNARRACGQYEDLTQELVSMHLVLRRLEKVAAKTHGPVNNIDNEYDEELQSYTTGCRKVLHILDNVLTKYNSLSKEERGVRKLWQSIKFGNGEVVELRDQRERLRYFTSAINLMLGFMTIGSNNRIEQQLDKADNELQELRKSINHLIVKEASKPSSEGSVFTDYSQDDTIWWRELRREMVKEGFTSSTLNKHRRRIMSYVQEIGNQGLMDIKDANDTIPNDLPDTMQGQDTEHDEHGTDLSLQRDEELLYYWQKLIHQLKQKQQSFTFVKSSSKGNVANSFHLRNSGSKDDCEEPTDPETRTERLLGDGSRWNDTDNLHYERFRKTLDNVKVSQWVSKKRGLVSLKMSPEYGNELFKACCQLFLHRLLIQIQNRKLPVRISNNVQLEAKHALRFIDKLEDLSRRDVIEEITDESSDEDTAGEDTEVEHLKYQAGVEFWEKPKISARDLEFDNIWHHVNERLIPRLMVRWVMCSPGEREARSETYTAVCGELESCIERIPQTNHNHQYQWCEYFSCRYRKRLVEQCQNTLLAARYFKASQEQETQQWLWRDASGIYEESNTRRFTIKIDIAQRLITSERAGTCSRCFSCGRDHDPGAVGWQSPPTN